MASKQITRTGRAEAVAEEGIDATLLQHVSPLTNLYNARPQWLTDAHDALDAAVAAAYGWPADISDEDALRELLALNVDGG